MMWFDLDTRDYGSYHSESYGEGPYDYNWRDDKDIQIMGLTVSKGSCGDVALFPNQHEPSVGDVVFIVVATYSSGDSFGNSSGNKQFVYAFTDRILAYTLRDYIIKDNGENPDYDFEKGYIVFEDVPVSVNTWKGYFECLDGVEVLEILLGASNDKT